ncbi:hypothetical protein OGH69_02610 [Flavobacterium sp. MFBS3-15]|uniref:GyrI-like domain-containing protein n=1 Tax=Flavobacterium sp. MFBS3-15 TaxID=2989816 RepID=UPI0022359F83|nr:GyrI-like domain-containing protein [Flavobacterium sp. MFBS3-15]MCW4467843.1 hypothetical protein [Flavobacterium sp. MFBS3-15]
MKIVKYVFLLLLLSAIAITVFIATQDGKYDITKEQVIKAPKAVLYNYISEYRNWENTEIISDSTATYTYPEVTSGKGASMAWKKDNTEGRITTVNLMESDSIIQKATIDGLDSEMAWSFKDTLGGTKVRVRMQGKLSFQEKAYALLKGHAGEKMESVLEKGLKNIGIFLVDELAKFNVEVKNQVTKTGGFYIGQSVNSKTSDVQKKALEIFPKLAAFVKENKIATNGAPFILYKKFSTQRDSAYYMICFPIKEEMYTAPGSEYEGNRLEAFQALKTTLKGDYSHLPKAWAAARKHMAEKGIQENTSSQYVELFSKGTAQTKRPSEWVTDIYIPIGAPAPTTPEAAENNLSPGDIPVPTGKPVAKPAEGIAKPASGSAGATNRPAVKPTGQSTTKPQQKPATNP